MKTTDKLKVYFRDVLHLVYPEICLVCETELTVQESHVCSFCDSSFSETSYHLFQEPSPFDQLFWGRAPLESTFALYFFQKKSPVQSLLFALKYKHASNIGTVFGKRIGQRMLSVEKYNGIQQLIPVPLHPKKQFQRGYNQSEALAAGISDISKIPVATNLVQRTTHTSSQTRKNRFQRWDNVSSVFYVSKDLQALDHVAIVDDVVTTGSTVEAMIQAMRSVAPDLKISVITLAIASY